MCVCVCVCVCTCACVCVCTYVYVCAGMFISVCIPTYHICSNFLSEQLSGKKRPLEWNCKVSERLRIIGMGGRIFRIDDGELEPSKNGCF